MYSINIKLCEFFYYLYVFNIMDNKNPLQKTEGKLICTPKVRHFWRCIFLWVKQEEKIKDIVQNLK